MLLSLSTNRIVVLAIFTPLVFLSVATACPLIDGMVDMNCDGKLKIAATGDSIVRGTGDDEGNSKNAGWVYDLKGYFPTANVRNLGIPGTTSQRLRSAILSDLDPGDDTYKKLIHADYILVEVGTNEYWNKAPVSETVKGIKRLEKSLRKFYEDTLDTTAPIIVTATVPQSKRGFQNPFLLSVDNALLKKQNSLNVRIRFDQLGKSIISSDLLHPSPDGYDQMAQLVNTVLTTVILAQAQDLRPDLDSDGIFDLFEVNYGTDTALADTDADGVIDGDEVFVNLTDPLDPTSF